MNAVEPKQQPEPLYTIKEAAKRLKVSRQFVYSEVAKGKLGRHRFGRKILIREKHIRDYLDRTERPADDDPEPEPKRKPTTTARRVLQHLVL